MPRGNKKRSVDTTAKRAYSILEIRLNIWRCLQQADLVTCMRLEKMGMEEVGKLLYHEILYRVVNTFEPGRRHLASIKVVNAHLNGPLARDLNNFPEGGQFALADFRSYDKALPAVLRIVHRLQKLLPNLIKIRFGVDPTALFHGEQSWIVHLHPKLAPLPPNSIITTPLLSSTTPIPRRLIRHVDYLTTVEHFLSGPPPPSLFTCPTAIIADTISGQFDLTLNTDKQNSYRRHAAAWLDLLRDDPSIHNLRKFVNFGPLPVTLDYLIAFLQRQKNGGQASAMSTIFAENIREWVIPSFRSFASIAPGLVVLKLAKRYMKHHVSISPHDLTDIVSIVRNNLPHLKSFHFSMKGIEEAEIVCKDALARHPIDLDRTGSLRDLRIYVANFKMPLFNMIRCLSEMTEEQGVIMVEPVSVTDSWDEREGPNSLAPMDQYRFLVHLRTQSAARKAHLAHIDFSTLRARTYAEVFQLEYSEDGTPLDAWRSKAAQWADRAVASHTSFNTDVIPKLQEALLAFSLSTSRLQQKESTKADSLELLEESLKVTSAMYDCQRAVRKAVKIIGDSSPQEASWEGYTRALNREYSLDREVGGK